MSQYHIVWTYLLVLGRPQGKQTYNGVYTITDCENIRRKLVYAISLSVRSNSASACCFCTSGQHPCELTYMECNIGWLLWLDGSMTGDDVRAYSWPLSKRWRGQSTSEVVAAGRTSIVHPEHLPSAAAAAAALTTMTRRKTAVACTVQQALFDSQHGVRNMSWQAFKTSSEDLFLTDGFRLSLQRRLMRHVICDEVLNLSELRPSHQQHFSCFQNMLSLMTKFQRLHCTERQRKTSFDVCVTAHTCTTIG